MQISADIDPAPAAAARALLDGLDVQFEPGAELPQMWHWFYLLPDWPQRELGADGHPRAGIPAPPEAGRRRMFAGGRTVHLRPLVVGQPARRTVRIETTKEKAGSSGSLTFVTVRHEIEQGDALCISEEQDIVYRGADSGSARPPGVEDPAPAEVDLGFEVDPVLLFRFSALTKNAHRIHYDRPYAEFEGYADLVVHGPLQIVLMAAALRQAGADFTGRQFSYRLLAPAIGQQGLRVRASSQEWAEVRDRSGVRTASSRIEEAA